MTLGRARLRSSVREYSRRAEVAPVQVESRRAAGRGGTCAAILGRWPNPAVGLHALHDAVDVGLDLLNRVDGAWRDAGLNVATFVHETEKETATTTETARRRDRAGWGPR